MKNSAHRLKNLALYLASRYGLPEFYSKFSHHHAKARHLYFNDPLVQMVREHIEPELESIDCLGHGISHSRKVGWDCATLLSVELTGISMPQEKINRMMILGLLAGLFHDICRLEENHAERGAQRAAEELRSFPLSNEEISAICRAIRNHEAFIRPVPCIDPASQLLSDCLYDADKFRWGCDTFTHTLWCIVEYRNMSIEELVDRFPWGIQGIERIRQTFRTTTGKSFGPEIIDQGLELGRQIYRYLLDEVGGEK
ncbi:hypothetical protein [Thermodesulforhabdus norvegica]|uniref:HD domain-containing protein n=1 Tax=Thermodesulforhabdus norvegica TaxID=39841 RepID=A0A1I4VZL1_9BACT|nr:hypothetical protein [Thermodesulforhabdus norvegica]SFN06457.1 hypothetical protein SAMN05660836_02534 [Thermodesulforhabdus norvegica]